MLCSSLTRSNAKTCVHQTQTRKTNCSINTPGYTHIVGRIHHWDPSASLAEELLLMVPKTGQLEEAQSNHSRKPPASQLAPRQTDDGEHLPFQQKTNCAKNVHFQKRCSSSDKMSCRYRSTLSALNKRETSSDAFLRRFECFFANERE